MLRGTVYKNLPYEHYLWLYQSVATIRLLRLSVVKSAYNFKICLFSKCLQPKTMRLLSNHILPRNVSNFTCSHLDLINFPGGETPGIYYKCGKGEGR